MITASQLYLMRSKNHAFFKKTEFSPTCQMSFFLHSIIWKLFRHRGENNHLLLKRHIRIFDKFVKDPHTVGKVGQVTKVKVLEVDEKRKWIALTMKLTDAPASQIQEAWGIGKREQSRDRKDRSADPSRNGKPDLIQQWLRRLRGWRGKLRINQIDYLILRTLCLFPLIIYVSALSIPVIRLRLCGVTRVITLLHVG